MLSASVALPAIAQSQDHLAALKGLSPVSVLENTPEGKAALTANLKITGGIQNGDILLPTLLPFAEQRQQALRDAFITGGNLCQLSDGLGTALGSGYLARAHYIDHRKFTNFSPVVARVFSYALRVSGRDSTAGKYFFANGTTNGKTAASNEAMAILTQIKGHTDVFGRSYGFPAGSTGAGTYGDARPFQTEPKFAEYSGPDYFNSVASNTDYNRGPLMNLVNSPSYPSGHTTYGYTGALVLALCVPERYSQMMARGAEYGTDRILIGSHYAMDVIGARTLAMYDMAHLLANDPAYMEDVSKGDSAITDFRSALAAARAELRKSLESACGESIETAAQEDTSRFNHDSANEAFFKSTLSYGLPVVYGSQRDSRADVGKLAPEAGYLLTVAFPSLTLEQADQILTDTEGPGGGFLDNGSAFGVYSRIDLCAAASKASQLSQAK